MLEPFHAMPPKDDYSTSGTVTSSTLVEVSLIANFNPALTYAGNPLVAELRYALLAQFGNAREVIATGPLYVYDTPT